MHRSLDGKSWVLDPEPGAVIPVHIPGTVFIIDELAEVPESAWDAPPRMTDHTTITKTILPFDSEERKAVPMARGLLDYFPAALAEVARLSQIGNDKHNPGEALHWARGKSMDHADCIMRHLAERGTVDTDGLSHSVKVAWRALALLQEELEAAGAPLPRGAR